ncbi:BTB/POZ and MATH domain-containing protein 2-like [Sorghum bicolor]|uniref:BTB/POZ and MATH domain-containing protein 2-like n=1 Tax=Sorghum bicolor TaxID=4558 RepID=UPI000B42405F|nr:BTB/POZ and MATH domain-containing protein 2-like [Sorghum bicolor]|eukprot:XP_021319326.1 BTB/POZ and MATH domain-containing protein 2-like [Sorghum bicolor]
MQRIEPAIFEALLQFLYTDSIPPPGDDDDDCGGGAHQEDNVTSQHLLTAADQHGVDMLRLTCEVRLCRSIDLLTVGTTLALAERHHCIQLKDACLEFIASQDMELSHIRPTCEPGAPTIVPVLASATGDTARACTSVQRRALHDCSLQLGSADTSKC